MHGVLLSMHGVLWDVHGVLRGALGVLCSVCMVCRGVRVCMVCCVWCTVGTHKMASVRSEHKAWLPQIQHKAICYTGSTSARLVYISNRKDYEVDGIRCL